MKIQKVYSDERELLYLFIVIDSQNPNSFWKPYYDILPTSFPSLIHHWSVEDQSELQGMKIIHDIIRVNMILNDTYYHSLPFIQQYFPDIEYTFERLRWAADIVNSRCWGLNQNSKRDFQLIPMADMLNHHFTMGGLGNFTESSFRIPAIVSYSAGEQIFDSYGAKANDELLSGYGFLVDDNPYTVYDISIQHFVSPSKLANSILEGLMGQSVNTIKLGLDKNGTTIHSFLTPFRIEQLDYSNILHSIDVARFECTKSILIERTSVRNAIEGLNSIYSRFPTTIEEDEEILLREDLSYNKRNAVFLRREIKQIILLNIQYLKDYWLSILRTGLCQQKPIFKFD